MEPGETRIREIGAGDAGSADLAAVARIYAHYVRHSVATFEETPPGLDYWREKHDEIAARGLPFLVAEAGGEVVGYAFASAWRPRPAYRWSAEDSVYVAPGLERRGIGSALLGTLLGELRGAGIRQVIAVIADAGDDASPGLHRRFGFVEAGRLRAVGFKFDRWIDTILMQLSLVESGELRAPAR